MTEIQLIQSTYKVLRVVLLILILAAAGFIIRLYLVNRAAQIEYLPYLESLENAYQLRKRNIVEEFDRKIRSAPTEIRALAFQQERSARLEEADGMYFSDKKAITKREYGVLERNWGEELRFLSGGEPVSE